MQKAHTTYSTTPISGGANVPTASLINHLFGPTYPGRYDQDTGLYFLHYPGLTFIFRVTPEFAEQCADSPTLPSEFADGSQPQAFRILLHSTNHAMASAMPNATMPPLVATLPKAESLYFEPITVVLGSHISFNKRNLNIGFGALPQQLLANLGAPSAVVQNRRNLTTEASPMAARTAQPGGLGVYIFNYTHLGIDFVFDYISHTLQKIILHTNMPSHPDFSLYSKCNFSIDVGITRKGSSTATKITADSRWSDIERLLGAAESQMTRSESDTPHPFGSTAFRGYEAAVFEVMANEHLASLQLFKSQ